jgi:hypothetical protein
MSVPAPRVLYSYSHAATGFAARLTGRQAARLASQRSVLAVVPDATLQLHTTLTPSFLGLSASSGLLPASNGTTDVVIGVMDSGVYPIDRDSFAADPSLPPLPPGKFRGSCISAPSFDASAYCHGKLVRAKALYEGYEFKGQAIFTRAKELGELALDRQLPNLTRYSCHVRRRQQDSERTARACVASPLTPARD